MKEDLTRRVRDWILRPYAQLVNCITSPRKQAVAELERRTRELDSLRYDHKDDCKYGIEPNVTEEDLNLLEKEIKKVENEVAAHTRGELTDEVKSRTRLYEARKSDIALAANTATSLAALTIGYFVDNPAANLMAVPAVYFAMLAFAEERRNQ
ncbi:hypothetical protein HY489_06095 [Candidatus Woesearchaeota archaeon]|nr:hypothetical protein [Candidatus Woesearchaeota archaeon]